MSDGNSGASGLRMLLTGAAVVIVIAGLKAAGSIIVPVLVAAFLAILFVPVINRLQRLGLPDWAAATIAFLGAAAVVVLVTMVVGRSVADFRSSLPEYGDRLQSDLDTQFRWLQRTLGSLGIDASAEELSKSFDGRAAVRAVGSAAGAVADLLSNTFFVILTVAFILGEAAGLPRKLGEALDRPDGGLGNYGSVVGSVRDYLAIKTKVSLATGALVGVLVWAFGIDYVLLWALTAFLLNYVPTVGSLIAATPAVLLAFVQHGWKTAAAVGAGYVVINVVMGSILEPRLMGRKLGLSSLVVFLSLVFWGWVWGPLGMLLSVPLTMLVKILLEHSQDLRWVAILMGPGGEQLTAASVHEEAEVEQQGDERDPEGDA